MLFQKKNEWGRGAERAHNKIIEVVGNVVEKNQSDGVVHSNNKLKMEEGGGGVC